LIKQALGRLALYHERSNLIGMPFVRIALLADTTLELDTAALLHHVRGLVCLREQVHPLAEHNMIPGRIGLGTHFARGRRCLAADVGLNRRDIMAAKRALYPVDVRQRGGWCCRTVGRSCMNRGVADLGRLLLGGLPLYWRCEGVRLLDQRAFPGRWCDCNYGCVR
jgi:hypothetical protein